MLLAHPRVDPSQPLASDSDLDALCVAARHGHLPLVERLLADPRVDPSADDSRSLVAAACGTGFTRSFMELQMRGGGAEGEEMRWRVKSCLDPSGTDSGRTAGCLSAWRSPWDRAMERAAQHTLLAVADRLLADPRVDPSARDCEAFRRACATDFSALAARLQADPRVDPSAGNNAALVDACHHSDSAMAHWLLDLGDPRVDPSARESEAVEHAARRGDDVLVERLLSYPRVNPWSSRYRKCAAVAAAEAGHVQMVERLLADPRIDPAVHGTKALEAAARSGKEDLVERLLADERWAHLQLGGNALPAAVRSGSAAIIHHVLSDSRVVPDKANWTRAVELACSNGDAALCERLLSDPRMDMGERADNPLAAVLGLYSEWHLPHWAARAAGYRQCIGLLLSSSDVRSCLEPGSKEMNRVLELWCPRQVMLGLSLPMPTSMIRTTLKCVPAEDAASSLPARTGAIAGPAGRVPAELSLAAVQRAVSASAIAAEAWRRRRRVVLARVAAWRYDGGAEWEEAAPHAAL